MIAKNARPIFGFVLAALAGLLLQGCANVTTFPTAARPGDTVALMVGGSEQARKSTVAVTLTDAAGGVWDLQALGKVRSVFSVRPDGRAEGLYYSSSVDQAFPWSVGGHEPIQTVLILDLPPSVPSGVATIQVSLNAADNASGFPDPVALQLEILPGTGVSDPVEYRRPILGAEPTDFSSLEPAPYAKVSLPAVDTLIGAASFVIDFDPAVLNGGDIDIYVPQATVRLAGAPFGANTQRMVSWRQNGSHLYVDVISPKGISARYLQFHVIQPPGIGSPNFTLSSSHIYDTAGNPIAGLTPSLEYFP